ncbi:transglycosylase SLT domain-containing protein [Rhizobium sp. PAMB 3174]
MAARLTPAQFGAIGLIMAAGMAASGCTSTTQEMSAIAASPAPASADTSATTAQTASAAAPIDPTAPRKVVTADDESAVEAAGVAGLAPDSTAPAQGQLAYAGTDTSSASGAVSALAYATPDRDIELLTASIPVAQALAAEEATYVDTGNDDDSVPDQPSSNTLEGLIKQYADLYKVPLNLVRRVVHRESRYNPTAYNRGNYGLMQIRYNTARGLGYNGEPNGLLDAETNLKYAVKYLKGAWLVADKDEDKAVSLYARGYYYDAKRKNMLYVLAE